MEINEIVNIIGTIGFPCVIALLLLKNNQEQIDIIRENTKVIQALADRIDCMLAKGDD
nr:MAG TPA: YvrJ protein family protein [Microviridae sp.]